MATSQDDGKPFCVVRFIDVPFDAFNGVAQYVCVPRTWIILRSETSKKVAVAYPSDEEPNVTKVRAKRRENYGEEWKVSMAETCYDFATYREAEDWINLHVKRSCVEKDPEKRDSQTFTSRLGSGSQNDPLKYKRDEQPKPNEISRKPLRTMSLKRTSETKPQASGSAGNDSMGPGCLNRERSTVIGERDQTEAAATSSSDKPSSTQHKSGKVHQSSPVRQAEKLQPSLLIKDVHGPTEVICIDKKGDSLHELQPSKADRNRQSQRASTTTASMAPPQPTKSVEHIVEKKTEVRPVRETDTNQTPRPDRICNQMVWIPALNIMNEIPKSLANSVRHMAIDAQNSSKLMDPRRPLPPERQEPAATQNSPQKNPHFQVGHEKCNDMNSPNPKVVLEKIDDIASVVQHTPINKPRRSPLVQRQQQPMDTPDALQRSSGSHSIAQRTSLEILMDGVSSNKHQNNPGNFYQEPRQELRRTPTGATNPAQPARTRQPACPLKSTSIASQTVLNSNALPQRQPSPNRDTQPQPRLSEPVNIPNSTSNDRRLSTVQGVDRRSPPHVQPSIPVSSKQSPTNIYTNNCNNLQHSEGRLQGKPVDISGSKVASQNVTPQQYVKRLTAISEVERPSSSQQVPSGGNIVKPRTQRPFRSADQTTKRMEIDPACPVHSSSQFEMFTSTSDCAATSAGQSSSADTQPHTRVVLEQQMLDHFSTIITQVGSNINYSTDIYKRLDAFLLETVDAHKKLLEAAESVARFSGTVTPRILPIYEERQSRAVKRANSSSHSQHTSRGDREPSSKKHKVRFTIIPPPEYDPNDTKWTLKYRELEPELKELLPGKGIFVNASKLMDAERNSNDCKKLASLVLEEVFSEIALIVCSTWRESQSPEGSWIERPPLDAAAWNVLDNYVILHGSKCEWKIDYSEILRAMDHKIYEIRAKHFPPAPRRVKDVFLKPLT